MELKEGPRACPGLSGWEKVKEGRMSGALTAGVQDWAGPSAISGQPDKRDMDGTIALGRTKVDSSFCFFPPLVQLRQGTLLAS